MFLVIVDRSVMIFSRQENSLLRWLRWLLLDVCFACGGTYKYQQDLPSIITQLLKLSVKVNCWSNSQLTYYRCTSFVICVKTTSSTTAAI